ncbi:hypothetical protein RvY_13797 [Ramazzottius varieornatus]|uniref:F-box domain-containing protein n=1 Tax=Ramazzottius varieornatus TaxID=947166 RepID=A0A1D1VT43_RAMVA|nr:hypothetical protein RvY_13797 [Ramazzottius varieornatus]
MDQEEPVESTDVDEELVSTFTLPEVWQRLPWMLVEETFAFLSLQDGQRLRKLRTSVWKAVLQRQIFSTTASSFFTGQKTKHRDCNEEEDKHKFYGRESVTERQRHQALLLLLASLICPRLTIQTQLYAGS